VNACRSAAEWAAREAQEAPAAQELPAAQEAPAARELPAARAAQAAEEHVQPKEDFVSTRHSAFRPVPFHSAGARLVLIAAAVLLCACNESQEPSGAGGGSASAGTDSSGAGMTHTDCTFPNDSSICGCGNACVGDPNSPSYGLCESCGPNGSGCSSDDIWCCSDASCPAGLLCSTLSPSPNIGYHLCVPDLAPCSSTGDCYAGETCGDGYCREAE